MITRILTIVLICQLCFCTGRKSASKPEIIKYLLDPKNKLHLVKQIQDFELELTFKPHDLVATDFLTSNRDRKSEFDSLSGFYSKYYYFILSIKHKGKDLRQYYVLNEQVFFKEINQLINDACLISTDKKCNNPVDTSIIDGFGLVPNTYIMVFDAPQDDEFEISIDGINVGFGKVGFVFEKKEIDKIPHLII